MVWLNGDSTSSKSSEIGGVIRYKYGNWVVGLMGNIYEAKNIISKLLALHNDFAIALA